MFDAVSRALFPGNVIADHNFIHVTEKPGAKLYSKDAAKPYWAKLNRTYRLSRLTPSNNLPSNSVTRSLNGPASIFRQAFPSLFLLLWTGYSLIIRSFSLGGSAVFVRLSWW